jgi:hypothetical protein
MSDWQLHGLNFCDNVLNTAYKLELTESQKIIIMDFAIGITRSDGNMQQSEINFINTLMRNIKIEANIIESRYGNWSIIQAK